MQSRFARWIPALGWLRGYPRENLRGDVLAGLTTAVLLVPQAMAYAMLAGLPPIYGLYASTVPLVVYALFGTSRQLAVGPVAMVSLLVAAAVGALAEPGSPAYIESAVLMATLVGGVMLTLGLLRAGFVTNFLSHPVIAGFTAAAAFVIGFSQLTHLLGLDLPRTHLVHETVLAVVDQIGAIAPVTALIGGLSVVLLVALQRFAPGFPRALTVVVLGSAAVALFGLDAHGVAIVGDVPAGFPAPSLPVFDVERVAALAPTAFAIALIAYVESISVARAFARKARQDIDPNQELVGLGAANLAGSLFSGYPVTGGFSRTAVNAQAGARTGVAALVTALVVTFTLLFLTPAFRYLPKATLAAVIMVAVFGLIDLSEVRKLWKVKRADLAMMGLTFAATLALGIEQGILVGVGTSLLAFVVRTTHPHTAVLGRLPGSNTYRNVKNYPDAETLPGLLILRMDAQLYFGNVMFLKNALRELEASSSCPLKAVVFDASSINQLDSSADDALVEIAEDYAERGIQLFFASVKGPVQEVMSASGLAERLGETHYFLELHDAVEAAAASTGCGTTSDVSAPAPRGATRGAVPASRPLVSVP